MQYWHTETRVNTEGFIIRKIISSSSASLQSAGCHGSEIIHNGCRSRELFII
jgi:hypothetical protein